MQISYDNIHRVAQAGRVTIQNIRDSASFENSGKMSLFARIGAECGKKISEFLNQRSDIIALPETRLSSVNRDLRASQHLSIKIAARHPEHHLVDTILPDEQHFSGMGMH